MLTFVYWVNIGIFEYATGSCKDISSITSTQNPVHSALNGCRAYDCVGVNVVLKLTVLGTYQPNKLPFWRL